jgi:hypothetical protein
MAQRPKGFDMNTVFVSFPFDGKFDRVFDLVRALSSQRSLNAVRIDQASMLATPIANSVQLRIREARLVVADVTGSNPNVLHEVGLAQAFGKPLVLLTQEDPDAAPFNIRGHRFVRYDPDDLGALRTHIDHALAEETSPHELLRAMLAPSTLGRPSRDSRFVIAASPLSYRRARGRSGGYIRLRRTSSDYVGVRGILQSFGLLFDFDVLPDTLDPEDCDDSVLQDSMTLYSIASPKANRWTGMILHEYGKRWAPRLTFGADPASPDVRNVNLSIFCDQEILRPHGWSINGQGDRYARDFGLIVRGPSPYDPDCMVAVIAGRSSLGTEAACLAFTDPKAVGHIHQRLGPLEGNLEDHKQPFWVVVSMQRALGDEREEAIPETLRIERVERFQRL